MRAARLRGRSGVSQLVIRCIALLVVLLAAALGAAAPAGARVDADRDRRRRDPARRAAPPPQDAVEAVAGARRRRRRASRCRGRASRRTPSRRCRRPASSRRTRTTRSYRWGVIDAAVDRLDERRDQADPDARRTAAAVGVGQPGARQSALPAERARIRELRHGGRRPLRGSGRPVHPLERAEPAGVDAAAGRLRQEALHPGLSRTSTARWSSPRTRRSTRRTRSPSVLIGALAPAGGDLKSDNANMRPLEFLRGLGCLDGKLRPVHTGALPHVPARARRRHRYHPHSTRHAPSQPYAHPDNADLGSLKKIERLLDELQRRHRLQGATTPLGLWLDEYGYQTNPPDKLRGVSPGAPGPLPPAGRVHRLARPARRRCSPSTCGRTSRHSTGGSTPAGSRGCTTSNGEPKPALAHFDDPIWVDFAGQRRLGPGAPRRRAHRDGPAARRRRRDAVGDARRRSRPGSTAAGRSRPSRSPSRRIARSRTTGRPAPSLVGGAARRGVGRRGAGRAVRRHARRPARRRHRGGRAGPAVVRGVLDGVLGGAELPRRHAPEPDLRPPHADARGARQRRPDDPHRRQLDRPDLVEPDRRAAPGWGRDRRHARVARRPAAVDVARRGRR